MHSMSSAESHQSAQRQQHQERHHQEQVSPDHRCVPSSQLPDPASPLVRLPLSIYDYFCPICIFCSKSTINQYPEYLDSQVDEDPSGTYSEIPQSDLDKEPLSSEIENPFSFDSPSVTAHSSPPSTSVPPSHGQLRPAPTPGLQAAHASQVPTTIMTPSLELCV